LEQCKDFYSIKLLLNFYFSDWFAATVSSSENNPAFCFVRKLDVMLIAAERFSLWSPPPPGGGGGYSSQFRLGVCPKGSYVLTLFKERNGKLMPFLRPKHDKMTPYSREK